jgi:hypothetical protein
MALVSSSLWASRNKHKKRTRQGTGRGTKWGTKPQGKANKKQLQGYKKKPRGQGK